MGQGCCLVEVCPTGKAATEECWHLHAGTTIDELTDRYASAPVSLRYASLSLNRLSSCIRVTV